MVFAPIAFFEFLEMHEGVVPGVEEKILLPALPIKRPILDGPGSEHFGDRFQELERNKIEARLAVCASGATRENPHVAPVSMLNLAHYHMVPRTFPFFLGGRLLPDWEVFLAVSWAVCVLKKVSVPAPLRVGGLGVPRFSYLPHGRLWS
jgi:hypothetical protein